LAVAAAPIAAPALENLFKFNKKYFAVKQLLETKIVEIYSRECCSRLPEKHEEPPSNSGRDGEAGQAAQGGQGDLDRAGQPAGRRLWEPDAGRVLYLKEEQIPFQRNSTTHHPIIFFLRVGEGCIL
jgi:hypothetical protein